MQKIFMSLRGTDQSYSTQKPPLHFRTFELKSHSRYYWFLTLQLHTWWRVFTSQVVSYCQSNSKNVKILQSKNIRFPFACITFEISFCQIFKYLLSLFRHQENFLQHAEIYSKKAQICILLCQDVPYYLFYPSCRIQGL